RPQAPQPAGRARLAAQSRRAPDAAEPQGQGACRGSPRHRSQPARRGQIQTHSPTSQGQAMSQDETVTSTKSPRWYWEDFTPGLSMTFGPREVGREEIVQFAKDFDPQPFHLDEEAGKASLFGG